MNRTICCLMVLCLLVVSIPALALSKGDLLIVANCESWVSLRSSASTNAKRLKKLPKGTYANYVGSSGNGFYRVLHNGTYGYVLKRYLETPNYAMRVTNCKEYVSLRAAPKTTARQIDKIPLGAMLYWESETANGFVQVFYNGRYGYVLERYLKPIDKDEGEQRYVTNCDSFISLRSGPSTSSSRLAKIPLNAKVTSLGSVGKGMEYVYYDGQYGFVLSKYLRNSRN